MTIADQSRVAPMLAVRSFRRSDLDACRRLRVELTE
jgi:hypothetical protein